MPASQYACMFPIESNSNPNSAIEYYLQCGSGLDAIERTKCTLLKEILHEAAFDQLRTKEQLGYVVWGMTRRTFASMGIRIVIMGDYDSIYLENRIEAFLQTFRDVNLQIMSLEEFEKAKQGLHGAYMQKPENMSRETGHWWNAINDGTFDFMQIKESIDALEKITYQDLLTYYDEFILPTSKGRTKLSSHYRSQKMPSKLRAHPSIALHAADEHEMFASSLLKELSESHGIEMVRDELFVLLSKLLTPAETAEVPQAAVKIAEYLTRISKEEFSHECVTEEILKTRPGLWKTGEFKLSEETIVLNSETAVLNEKLKWPLSPAAVPVKPLMVAYCRL